jgi:hypothetical protein
MTKAIWKYQLQPGTTRVMMPVGAKALHVDKQANDTSIFAWFLVTPKDTREEIRTFHVIGTGHEINDERLGDYLGTVLLYDDKIVVHVFEERR